MKTKQEIDVARVVVAKSLANPNLTEQQKHVLWGMSVSKMQSCNHVER